MLTINGLGMHYGAKSLFSDVQLILNKGTRYGLIGANGAGKSTLLRLIAGSETPNAGSISMPNRCSIGLLKQDHFSYENDRVVDVVIQGNTALWNALQEKDTLLGKTEFTDSDGIRLGELEEIIITQGGYEAESHAQILLTGLGIAKDHQKGPLKALSGGYKLRVLLAQLLFQKPDVMLLDEPTNHLDIVSISWLEKFLMEQYNGLLLFISHDQDFLNNVATHILDIDYGTIIEYVGNYNQFVKNKQLALEQKQHELAGQERRIADLQRYVDRFRYKASLAKQAQSKLKMIDRIKLTEIKSTSRIAPKFVFKQQRPAGKVILKTKELVKQFNNNIILCDVNLELERGHKYAIIGPNGAGKSTLLKLLLGKLKADEGSIEWGHNVQTAYYAQDHHDNLSEHGNAWEWLETTVQQNTSKEIRSALGRMLFSGDEVYKAISLLSGGEATRLVFARILLQQANVLVLDEPTNHLDLEAIDALGDALHTFPGTVLFVSHDRHFVSKIATNILAVSHQAVEHFPDTYQAYTDRYGDDYLARLQ